MEPFVSLTSRVVPLPIENIDTDQIIPARFLTTTERKGLGRCLFAGWRFDANGDERPDFALNQPHARGARVLLAGDNFGCGSSREHAVWALLDYGFRAVISTRFADIFRANALKNGLLVVEVEVAGYDRLLAEVEKDPATEITVDLASQTLTLPDRFLLRFPVDGFSKYCLLHGVDQLGYLLERLQQIEGYERTSPARVDTTGA